MDTMRERAVAVLTIFAACAGLAGCGERGSSTDDRSARDERTATDVGLRDKRKTPARHDEASVRRMLQSRGASSEDASRIVRLLSGRLTPDEMHVWLSHPKKSHPVPDPEFAKKMEDAGLVGGPLHWTAVNAIAAGKTQLVIDEAKRFAADG